MTKVDQRGGSMIAEMEADPSAALELAAARSAVEGSALLSHAFAAAGLSQKELAQRVGVTEGRVSQVLGTAVNLRLSTVGRYLQAMGFRLSLAAIDADGNAVDAGFSSSARRHRSRPPYAVLDEMQSVPVMVAA